MYPSITSLASLCPSTLKRKQQLGASIHSIEGGPEKQQPSNQSALAAHTEHGSPTSVSSLGPRAMPLRWFTSTSPEPTCSAPLLGRFWGMHPAVTETDRRREACIV